MVTAPPPIPGPPPMIDADPAAVLEELGPRVQALQNERRFELDIVLSEM